MKRIFWVTLFVVVLSLSGIGAADAYYLRPPETGGQALPPSPSSCGPYNHWSTFVSEGQILEFDIRVEKPGGWVDFGVTGPDAEAGFAPLYMGHVHDRLHLEYRVPEGASGVHGFTLNSWDGRGMTLYWTATDRLDMDKRIERVAGNDRYGTAIAASQWGWGSHDTTVAVIATGSNYADALAASSLAGVRDCPVLLTPGSYSWDKTYPLLKELDRLRVETVYVVGGSAAVPEDLVTRVETPESGLEDPTSDDTLDWGGAAVERIGGSDRYETASLVAQKTVDLLEADGGFDGSVFIASGERFADALAAAPYSAATGRPLLLVRTWHTPQVTNDALESINASDAIVVGGASVVSGQTVAELGVDSMRIAGSDRYKTSLALTEYALDHGWGDIGIYGLATGYTYPDSLPGGAATAHAGGILLLTPPNTLSNDAALHLHDNRTVIGSIPVFGGIGAVTGVTTGEVHFFIQ